MPPTRKTKVQEEERKTDETPGTPPGSFSPAFAQRIATAKGVRSIARLVKLGRAKARIAGSRAFLRIMGEKELSLITIEQIYQSDDDFRVLKTWKSIGDAMCGNPDASSPDARGLGMRRHPTSRELIGDRPNVEIAVRCLSDAGYSSEEIAGFAGKGSVEKFETWVDGLPIADDMVG